MMQFVKEQYKQEETVKLIISLPDAVNNPSFGAGQTDFRWVSGN